MLQATVKASKFKLDAKRLTQKFEEAVRLSAEAAAREWLRAVIPHVPVATGMARGSLLPLGRYLRMYIPIKAPNTEPGRVFRKRKVRISEGEALGSHKHPLVYHRNQYGIYAVTFQWNTLVPHWAGLGMVPLEDYHNPRGNWPPWKAVAAGNAAYLKKFESEIVKRLPKLSDFIIAEEKTYAN